MAAFDLWIQSLEARHLSDLRFPEVSRALRALSSTYIERRGSILHGAALGGAGKRAAFALFYGPLHYLIVEELVRRDVAGFVADERGEAFRIAKDERADIFDRGAGRLCHLSASPKYGRFTHYGPL